MMKYLIAVIAMSIVSMIYVHMSAKHATYLELMAHPKYKMGQVVKLTEGFYAGCEVTITLIDTRWGTEELQYIGTSPCINEAQRLEVRE